MTRFSLRALLVALLFGFAITPLLAQNAQMAGQITDPSGAVIPGANITITNIDTGVLVKTTSNAEGYYTVPQF